MKIKKIEICMILLVLAALLLAKSAAAAHIGISPATVQFRNVLRGGYSEKGVIITIDSVKPIMVSIKPRGEITSWLNFSALNFSVSKDKQYLLKVSARPPSATPNGNYTGFLEVSTGGFGSGGEGEATAIVRASVDLAAVIEVTDIEYIACKAGSFQISSPEKGDDIILKMNVENNGNIFLKPRISVDIWDQEQIKLIKHVEFSDSEITPTTQEPLNLKIKSSDLQIGQYWAEVSAIDCYASETLTFDVLEIGARKENGILLGINARQRAYVDETIPILVNFKNTGEKETQAKFEGKITRGEKIIQILESEKISVPVSEVMNFSFYFTPREQGKYIISGRVFYGKKRTFESSKAVEILAGSPKKNNLFLYLAYAILVFAAVFLLYKIRKERIAYSNKLREAGRIRWRN